MRQDYTHPAMLLSTAAILLITCLDWASTAGIALPPETVDYRLRVAQRPTYQEALRRNFPSKPS
jgi:hypothetical protein